VPPFSSPPRALAAVSCRPRPSAPVAQLAVAGEAVLDAGVVSERDGHARLVQLRQSCESASRTRSAHWEWPPPAPRAFALAFWAFLSRARQRDRRGAEDSPRSGSSSHAGLLAAAASVPVDGQVRREVDVLLLHPRDQRVVHLSVANRMQESVDAGLDEDRACRPGRTRGRSRGCCVCGLRR